MNLSYEEDHAARVEEYAYDAIVIGAGAAGIAAARELTSSGLQRVVVLEARRRVGGRAHTSDELGCGVALDHGAQWIHGLSKRHPMVELATTVGVAVSPMAGSRSMDRHSDGQNIDSEHIQKANQAFIKLKSGVRSYSQKSRVRDCSWSDAVVVNNAADSLQDACAKLLGGQESLELSRSLLHQRIYASLENYEGALIDNWSALHYDEGSCLPGGNGDVSGGYGALIVKHACNLEVKFDRSVTDIIYPKANDENVFVRCNVEEDQRSGQENYSAPVCIVTLPLGVLRDGNVSFSPPLPANKQVAIARLGVGLMDKIELLWDRRWWPSNVGSLRIASLDSTPTYHPWPWFLEPPESRNHPLGWAVLVCFVTGNFAKEIESMDDHIVGATCARALGRAFSCEVPQPKALHVTRWGQDPCSRGAWTFIAAHSSIDDVSALAEPIGMNGCVGFAGEHTCDGSSSGLDIGTVHGAWLSGIRVAKALLERCQCKFNPPSRMQDDTNDSSLRHLPRQSWRSHYRHCTDSVIPHVDGYIEGARIIVTSDPAEVADEFKVDPDESLNINAAQQCCGKHGRIVSRSRWGWLEVSFDDRTEPRWFTPFCLWVVEPPLGRSWRTSHRHTTDTVIPVIDGYTVGAQVIVTSEASDVAEEFAIDPDESPHVSAAQLCCGKHGRIVDRSE